MHLNQLLLDKILKRSFTFITYRKDNCGQEICKFCSLRKKSFLTILEGEEFKVKLVKDYPEPLESNIFYVKKNGRTVWYKEVKEES